MEEEKIYCTQCGEVIEGDDYDTIYGEPICQDCVDDYTVVCDRCDEIIWDCDSYSDGNTCLCGHCYDNYYTRCEQCDTIIHNDDTYEYDDCYYCHDCYQDIRRNDSIHEYSYKPEPIFYGDSNRYFGVKLEIDGSLEDGMEIVSHSMTLDYHKNFC